MKFSRVAAVVAALSIVAGLSASAASADPISTRTLCFYTPSTNTTDCGIYETYRLNDSFQCTYLGTGWFILRYKEYLVVLTVWAGMPGNRGDGPGTVFPDGTVSYNAMRPESKKLATAIYRQTYPQEGGPEKLGPCDDPYATP